MILIKKIKFEYLYRICILVFTLLFIIQPLLKFYNLHTNIADLGFFISNLSNVYDEWWRAFVGHIQPYMFIYGLLFKIFPINIASYILILSQSLILLFCAYLINLNYGKVPTIIFFLYYPVWNNLLFDFHFDHLSILLILLFLIEYKKENLKLCVLYSLLLMLVKEVFALQTIFCGLFIIIDSFLKKIYSFKYYLSGISLVLIGCLYFYLCTHYFLKLFTPDSQSIGIGSHAFAWLGNSYFEAIKTLIFHLPEIVVKILNNNQKVILILVLLLPLSFLSLFSPIYLIIGLPPLLISLLSEYENYYDYTNHYSAGIIISLLVSFYSSYNYLKLKLNIIILNSVIIFIAFMSLWFLGSTPFSRLFWSNKVWAYSYTAYIPSERNEIINNLITQHIPKNRKIIISSQNNINNTILANRKIILPFPLGIHKSFFHEFYEISFNRHNQKFSLNANKFEIYADYVVVDSKRPLFIIDKGCNYIYGKCLSKEIEQEFNFELNRISDKYTSIVSYDGFYIFKKNEAL